jgi:hypothetical protein
MLDRGMIMVGLATATLAAGAGYAMWHSSDAERAKRDVRERLVDPDSAVFADVEPCRVSGRLVYVTGLVNARNSMGGMTGKKRFVSTVVGDAMDSRIETGRRWNDPNLADKVVAARSYAAAHPMPCGKVLAAAQGELAGTANINPEIAVMNATEGMDSVDDPLADDPIVGNIAPLR